MMYDERSIPREDEFIDEEFGDSDLDLLFREGMNSGIIVKGRSV